MIKFYHFVVPVAQFKRLMLYNSFLAFSFEELYCFRNLQIKVVFFKSDGISGAIRLRLIIAQQLL